MWLADGKYMQVIPACWHYKAYGKIRCFLEQLVVLLNIDMVQEEDERIKYFMKRGWYYRYKFYLVWENTRKRFLSKKKEISVNNVSTSYDFQLTIKTIKRNGLWETI